MEEDGLPRTQPHPVLLQQAEAFRHIATRYDKLGANFFAFTQLASIRIFLRSIEPTA